MNASSKNIIHRPGELQAPQLDWITMDGSGSMMDKWWPMMGCLDQFMETLKAENVHSHGTAVVFDDDDLAMIQRDGLISSWQTFDKDPLGAFWGGTPLYDAINHHARMIKDLNPTKVSWIICTDGDDTGGKTDVTQAKAILDWARAMGWQITFIGADFNNYGQARALGANDSNAIGVQKERLGEAGKLLGKKRAHFGRTGEDINFSRDEQQQFGGYLPPPTK